VQGSCSIGDGTPLEYIEKGLLNNTIDTTVVKNLRYDLFSSVSAAKLGLTSIIDYDLETGENNSYMIDKQTGNIIRLVERGQGILEVPLRFMTPRIIPGELGDSSIVSGEIALYAFDILKKLNERERDYLIHARLGHLPKKTILTMKKNGNSKNNDDDQDPVTVIVNVHSPSWLSTICFCVWLVILNLLFVQWLYYDVRKSK
jgi:hypothetical protein